MNLRSAPDPDPGPAAPQALRVHYAAELDQLRLQVEVMALRVDQNLERMCTVLETGDPVLAAAARAADDGIDAMSVSLTERCHDILAREQPVARDLRFVVSVLRVLGEFERVGDLSLRVVNACDDHHLLRANDTTFGLLLELASAAVERYRAAAAAWAAESADAARLLLAAPSRADVLEARLTSEVLRVSGSDAAPIVVRTLEAGRALERIADHAGIIATRLLFLVTGDAGHLAGEVR